MLTDFLYIKLNQMKQDIPGLEDFDIKVYDEQEFAVENVKENEISIVYKRMTSSLTFNTITQPGQILILSEENSSEYAFALMNKFATTYNWWVRTEGTSKIKTQLSQPMTMSNFEIVKGKYRSVLFMAVTEYILENVVDIDGELKVNSEDIKYITFQMGFGMSGDSQPFPEQQLVATVKTVSSLSIQMTIPCVDSTLFRDVQKIMKGSKSGNSNFRFQFKLQNGEDFDVNMKLIAVAYATAKNDIPSLELGFTK